MNRWFLAVLLLLLLPVAFALRVDNVNIVEDSAIVVIDTVAPVGNLSHRVMDISGLIDISTPINVSFYVADLNPFSINLSTNVQSSTYINVSVSNNGNGTYYYIISAANFTGSQTVMYILYAYDLAGNLYTQTGSFFVPAARSTGGPASAGSGGGGGSPCSIDSISPKRDEYVQFSPVLLDRTVKGDIIVKNTGGSQAIYTFEVKDGEFYKKNCQFLNNKAFADINGEVKNTITCKVPDALETGSIVVKGCGTEAIYKLGMNVQKKGNLFSLVGNGDGQISPTALLWFGTGAVMLFLVALVSFGALFGKGFSWLFGK